jgi:hypothetical protein
MTTHRTSATAAKPFKGSFSKTCIRCGGDGVWKGWHRGTCFRCGGCGTDPTPEREWVFPTAWTTEQVEAFYAKKNEQAAKRAAKKTDARQERMAKACEQYPAVAALRASWLADDETPEARLWYTVSNAATDIMWKAFQYDLSEKQVALLTEQVARATKRIAEDDERDAKRADEKANAVLPVGRKVAIAGTVISRKWHEGNFGSTCKLTVKLADGAMVWFTEPKNLSVAVGDEVAGTLGEVVASDKDAAFGFGKRPTGFVVTKESEAARA